MTRLAEPPTTSAASSRACSSSRLLRISQPVSGLQVHASPAGEDYGLVAAALESLYHVPPDQAASSGHRYTQHGHPSSALTA